MSQIKRYNPELEKNIRPFLGPQFRLNPDEASRLEFRRDGEWWPIATAEGDAQDGIFNVMDYMADRSGTTDSTTAFKLAEADAYANGGGTVYAPIGRYIIRPRDEVVEPTAMLVLRPGVNLAGDGYETVIEFPTTASLYATAGPYTPIWCEGNNEIRNLRIDGRRDALIPEVVKTTFYGIHCKVNASDILVENVWIHSIPAKGEAQESFGFLTARGVSRAVLRGVTCWDIDGSGIALGNDNPIPELEDWGGGDHEATDCYCYDNAWQGISLYGCTGAQLKGCLAANNTKVGINVEHGHNITISGGQSTQSGQQNLRVMGHSRNVVVNDVMIFNSLGTAEISFNAGGYHRAIAGVYYYGLPDGVTLNDCQVLRAEDIEPGSGSVHHMQMRAVEAFTDPDDGPITLYSPYAHPRVTINCPNAENWLVTGWLYGEDDPELNQYTPGATFYNLRSFRSVTLGPLASWAAKGLSPAISSSQPYDGVIDGPEVENADATDPGAWTIISSTEGADYPSTLALRGNSRYHVKVRAKVIQSVGATISDKDIWTVVINRLGGHGAIALSLRFSSIHNSGDWLEAEGIAKTTDGPYRCLAYYAKRSTTASGASRFDIDYISVKELTAGQMQSDAEYLVERGITLLSELPQYGTWPTEFIVHLRGTTDGQSSGRIARPGGTYGTLIGVVGSTTIDTNQVTTSGVGALLAGQYITINGVKGKSTGSPIFRVTYIDVANILYLDDEADVTIVGATIAYSPPTWAHLFPHASSQFITELPLGSSNSIALARDQGGMVYLRTMILDGYLRPYVTTEPPQ